MSYSSHPDFVSGSSSSVPQPEAPGVPHGVWRPADGIVFRAGAADTRRAPAFGHPLAFDQAPSYGQVPAFGRAPSFERARSFEQSLSFDHTSSFGGTLGATTGSTFGSTSFNTSFGSTSSGSISFGSQSFGSQSFGSTSFGNGSTSLERNPFESTFESTSSGDQTPTSASTPSPTQPSPVQAADDPPAGRPPSPSPSAQTIRAQPFSPPSRPTSTPTKQSPRPLVHTPAKRHISQAAHAIQDEGLVIKNDSSPGSASAASQDSDEVEPPETDLDFKMSRTLFKKARNAPPGAPESFWSYTMYRNKAAAAANADSAKSAAANGNEVHARIQVHYCKSWETTERVCSKHFAHEPMLGFDLEWVADANRWQGPRKNVCLLQLSSPSRIGLFHLSLFPTQDMMPPALRKILESPEIIKAGVFIRGDATRLRNHLAVEMRGLIELSQLHRLVKYTKSGEHTLISKRLVSLAAQVEENLGLPLFKGQNVRSSNWSRPLDMKQIIYSASDAYASVQLFAVLEKERLKLNPTPPRPAFAELNKPIILASGAATAVDDMSELELIARNEAMLENGAVSTGKRKSMPSLSSTSSTTVTVTAAKTRRGLPLPKAWTDPRIVASHQWMCAYCASKPTVQAGPASLRAYHLWHANADLRPAAIAAMLRYPPLLTSTVLGYVISAVQLEGLPYDMARLKEEVIKDMPHKALCGKHRALAEACGYDVTGS